jgi:hypothetical protein
MVVAGVLAVVADGGDVVAGYRHPTRGPRYIASVRIRFRYAKETVTEKIHREN